MEETYLERDQVISKYHGSLVHFKRVFVIYQFMLQCLMEMLKKFETHNPMKRNYWIMFFQWVLVLWGSCWRLVKTILEKAQNPLKGAFQAPELLLKHKLTYHLRCKKWILCSSFFKFPSIQNCYNENFMNKTQEPYDVDPVKYKPNTLF